MVRITQSPTRDHWKKIKINKELFGQPTLLYYYCCWWRKQQGKRLFVPVIPLLYKITHGSLRTEHIYKQGKMPLKNQTTTATHPLQRSRETTQHPSLPSFSLYAEPPVWMFYIAINLYSLPLLFWNPFCLNFYKERRISRRSAILGFR